MISAKFRQIADLAIAYEAARDHRAKARTAMHKALRSCRDPEEPPYTIGDDPEVDSTINASRAAQKAKTSAHDKLTRAVRAYTKGSK